MKKSVFALLSVVSLFVFAACSHTPIPVAGAYIVAEVNGVEVETEQPIKVTYTGESLVGKGPINNWNCPVDPQTGDIGMGISTRMAGPPELMQLEDQLLKALDGAKLTSRSDDVLVVVKDGKDVIVMTPVDPTMTYGKPSPTAIPSNEM
ncbi:META domain-containing protein [Ruficoccus amylovorans]|uniref:META domain-containing protein n=1 Tax=Ruficoccus amylovorans TaxID=1804625 RepID=A0A842HCI5_9BACT|nr:META domain-containing protein [Ruficoccus amylovorans]MBC2593406.1 META domain-containing protein [Ruficoccus amylovorans]